MSSSGCYLQYMTEGSWNWRMMKHIFTELHYYDEDNNYLPFDYQKDEPFWVFQRKYLPNAFKPAAGRQPSA